MQGHDCLDRCTCELDEEGEFREFDDPHCEVVGHRREVRSVCFSPDGRTLVSGSEDESCKFWNVATGELLWTLEGADIVWSVAFGRDWARDQRWVAFSMGHHERLGAGSRVRSLDEGVVRMVLEAVDREERDGARDEALDDMYHSQGEYSDEDEGSVPGLEAHAAPHGLDRRHLPHGPRQALHKSILETFDNFWR